MPSPMEGQLNHRLANPRRALRPEMVILTCAVLLAGPWACAWAADYREDFESSRVSWTIHTEDSQVQVLDHRRTFEHPHGGQGAELIRLSSSLNEVVIRLDHPVQHARILDELQASVWVRSGRPGVLLALRVRCPNQLDPETGMPLHLDIASDPYNLTDRWQQLTVGTTQESVEKQLMLARRRLASTLGPASLDTRNMYVERVCLIVPMSQGATDLLIDDLFVGPIVPPSMGITDPPDSNTINERRECPIQMGPNRIVVNGKPFFPRFTAYQGENLDQLKELGINVALIERHDDQILIDELSRRGIWAMAPPPPPAFSEEGGVESTTAANLMPITSSNSPILFWMLGTRIPATELRRVERWIDQINSADRAFPRPRPIIADVISEERAFSRHVAMLGNSRHSLHTSLLPLEHREYLRYKKFLALPDRFSFTWIQTEAAVPNVETRHPSRDRPVIVEAEQIWLQAWEAICVGHRGFGFWKSGPLDQDSSVHPERRVALSLLNAQIDLLEPLLATGKVVATIPVSVQRNEQTQASSSTSRFIPSLRKSQGPVQSVHPEIQAAVIESDYGLLVVLNWYDNGGQFQPSQMAESAASFVVRGVEHARAWEVTTTSVQPLELGQPVPGGMEFRLPSIDQFAFVIITNDLELEARLSQKMRSVQERCARLWIDLARARVDRIRPTHELLQRVALAKVRDGDALLRSASQRIDEAEVALRGNQYDEARRLSRLALQMSRRLQRAHWENAVADLTSPVSSPHTICFETLPDHWEMVASLGRSVGTSNENLLRSGDFEDYDTVRADEWHAPPDLDPGQAVELYPDAYEGKYGLRIASKTPRSESTQATLSENILTAYSPRLSVDGGQIVIASGRVRVHEAATTHPDGFMIYDNIKGTIAALRWHQPMPRGQWQQFRLIREIADSGDFQLVFELNGDGDVRIDDVRVEALSPLQTASGSGELADRPRRNRLEWTPSLPKVPFWNGFRSDSQD